MISFFRKIRQKLLQEGLPAGQAGKVINYLKYATGEIFLVVVGILIALSINNWNETRKDQIAEGEFLEGIKNDLTEDRIYIEYILNRIEPKIEAYNQLNKDLPLDYIIDKIEIDSLLGVYIFVGQRTFYPISGSFQSAVAGNEINTYKNKELIRSIIKFYNSTYSRLIENGQILDERWDRLSQIYSHQRRLGHFDQLNDTKFSLILDDIHFHFVQLQGYQTSLISSIEEIDRIINNIEY
ncbi:hypothetical protein EF405_08105 [Cyclobacteriaceae bacterium YHN15]|nr:hypothetical protein EF405_08105 [Cyclobacteriaceae bacterium YHN15]